MAEGDKIIFRDLTISADNIEQEAYPLISVLRPTWKKEDIRSKTLSGGLINRMNYFHLTQDKEKADAIIVRVQNDSVEEMISRNKEFLALQIAQAAGCFQRLYVSFSNGLAYQYAPGRVLTMDDYLRPDTVKNITKQLCNFHHADVDSLLLFDLQGKPAKFPKTIPTLNDQFSKIPAKGNDPKVDAEFQEYRKKFTDEVLQAEMAYMNGLLKELDFPVCLNHVDFHLRNTLVNDKTGNISLLDYECAAYYPRARDLASVFISKDMFDAMGMTTKEDSDFTPEVRDMWIRSYMDAMYEKQGRSSRDIPESERELFDIEHRIMEAYCHLEHAISYLMCVNMTFNDLDFLQFIPIYMDRYFVQKVDLEGLKKRYLELKQRTK